MYEQMSHTSPRQPSSRHQSISAIRDCPSRTPPNSPSLLRLMITFRLNWTVICNLESSMGLPCDPWQSCSTLSLSKPPTHISSLHRGPSWASVKCSDNGISMRDVIIIATRASLPLIIIYIPPINYGFKMNAYWLGGRKASSNEMKQNKINPIPGRFPQPPDQPNCRQIIASFDMPSISPLPLKIKLACWHVIKSSSTQSFPTQYQLLLQ